MQGTCNTKIGLNSWLSGVVTDWNSTTTLYVIFVTLSPDSDGRSLEVSWQRMVCRPQTPRLRRAAEERANKAIPLFLHGYVILYYMSACVPACRCENSSAFSAQDRHECVYIQGTLPLSRHRLDMAPMVREVFRGSDLD